MSSKLNLSTLLTTTAVVALTSIAAHAQESAPRPAAAVLEEILVTAEKREASLQDTPVSVTALSGDMLQAIGITNFEDFQFFVPGITITNDSMAIVNVRGIGTSAFGVATDPSVAVYYDGVYIPRPTTGYQDMFDVERLELLRGPQGVLFGRNATGGSLNIISKAPSDELEGTFGVTIGNLERRTFSGTVSGPLSDRVRARATLMKNDRDGRYKDIVTGEDYQNQDTFAGRFTLAMDVTDAFETVLRADFNRDNETGYPSTRLSYPAEFAAAGATIPTRPDDVAFDTLPQNDVKVWGISATNTYTASAVTFKSITSYRKSTVAQIIDADATDLFLFDITLDENSKTFTQELQLTNNDPERLEWILGAFYLNEKGDGGIGLFKPAVAIVIPEANTTNAMAAFGQATYHATDRLRATVGLRLNYEKKDYNYSIAVNGTEVDAGDPKASWTVLTPKFGIDYDFNDDVMAYISATRGFKSGGFQLGDGQPFKPEFLWSYEVGLKSMLLEDHVRANIGAFYYDYSNLQVVEYINGVATTTNAGKSQVKGIEAEFAARVAEGFDLNASISYLDATYKVYFDGPVSLAGNTLPNSPKWNLTFGAQHRTPVGDLGFLTLRGDIAWRSKIFFKSTNDPRFANEDYALINARLAFTPPEENWEIALYGRNLTDKRYATYKTLGVGLDAQASPNYPLAVLGEPRQYGVQLRYSF
ncbi:MAG: TonB-dependent receptor [Pseudomonadota bacterium]